jgi:hypothetical protein
MDLHALLVNIGRAYRLAYLDTLIDPYVHVLLALPKHSWKVPIGTYMFIIVAGTEKRLAVEFIYAITLSV